jgi:hypothetical protein
MNHMLDTVFRLRNGLSMAHLLEVQLYGSTQVAMSHAIKSDLQGS